MRRAASPGNAVFSWPGHSHSFAAVPGLQTAGHSSPEWDTPTPGILASVGLLNTAALTYGRNGPSPQ